MRKIANQPGLDFTPQEGFAFAPLDLGPSKPAKCQKGIHDMPRDAVVCPACLAIEGEKQAHEQHERSVLQAAAAIKRGSDETPVFCVGVAGYLHIVPAAGFKRAFCGEVVNPKLVMRKERKSVAALAGAYCAECRGFIWP